ncbi:MAG: hypothetical protein L6R39_006684 [Caloplaca ligustica]|nr:MAG: hypothetical protein L6R39_006684 [Caloplaca ligustica]
MTAPGLMSSASIIPSAASHGCVTPSSNNNSNNNNNDEGKSKAAITIKGTNDEDIRTQQREKQQPASEQQSEEEKERVVETLNRWEKCAWFSQTVDETIPQTRLHLLKRLLGTHEEEEDSPVSVSVSDNDSDLESKAEAKTAPKIHRNLDTDTVKNRSKYSHPFHGSIAHTAAVSTALEEAGTVEVPYA